MTSPVAVAVALAVELSVFGLLSAPGPLDPPCPPGDVTDASSATRASCPVLRALDTAGVPYSLRIELTARIHHVWKPVTRASGVSRVASGVYLSVISDPAIRCVIRAPLSLERS